MTRTLVMALFEKNGHGALSQDAEYRTRPVQRTADARPALAQHIFSTEPNFNFL
jgi:hypothetical protein